MRALRAVPPARPRPTPASAESLLFDLEILGRPFARCAHGVLRDVVRGNNGSYRARTGWDACTGLGSPDGVILATALGAPVSTVVSAARSPERIAPLERRVIALENGSHAPNGEA